MTSIAQLEDKGRWVTLDGIDVPGTASTWCSMMFYWLIRAMNAVRICEIGVRGEALEGGVSTLCLLAASQYTHGHVWSMDIDECFSQRRAVSHYGLTSRHTFIQADSHETDFPCEAIDFLFIDGDHSYEGVKADYERHKVKVRPGGLIALHDTVSCAPTVGRLVRELKQSGVDIFDLPYCESGLALEVKR